MADEKKPQLSEEEIIARKLKIRRIISRVLIIIGAVSLIVFVVLAWLTKGNISTQTALDTQELRSHLKKIIALEKKYYEENGKYATIKFMSLSKEIERYDPNINGNFMYSFDAGTGIAIGKEKDATHDVNGDNDGTDGLTLSTNWEPGKTEDSEFFWTDEDIKDFKSRAAQQ